MSGPAVRHGHLRRHDGGGRGRDGEATGLHEVQKALAESHASQCGYCTPGFVMALYSMVKQRETGAELTMEDIEHGMDGNLCRCTGYRPILDAAKSFGDDAGKAHCKGTCPLPQRQERRCTS